MSDLIFTRCPHCNTLFRLASQQLSAAKGAVRCGQCFQVFNAMQHVVDATSVQAGGQTIPMPKHKSLEIEQPQPAITSTDVNRFSAIEIPEPASSLLASKPPRVSDNIFSSDSAFAIDEDPLFKSDKPKKKEKTKDEAWAEALLRELDTEVSHAPEPDFTSKKTDLDFIQNEGDDYFGAATEARSASEKRLEDDLSETFRGLTSTNFGNKTTSIELPNLDDEEPSFDADESWAQAMLKELENENKNAPSELSLIPSEKEKEKKKAVSAAKLATQEKRAEKKQSVKDQLDEFDFDALFQEEAGFNEPATDDTIVAPPVQKDNLFDFQPAEPQPLIDQIGPAAVEFTPSTPRPQKNGASQQLAWAFGCVVVLCGVFGLHLYFNFNQLSRDLAWRPWYEKACSVFKCSLPALVDTSQIRSRNLTLTEQHGNYKVDFLLKNNASFAQPFPMLELSFSDINGKPIARRLFKPNEYVRGELAGAKQMPAGVDIHFSIEVVKPSADAVNYTLNFFSVPE